MIELEKQLNCSQNHDQPIHMVVFDKKLKKQQRLLCNICMETFEADTKIIGFKKVLKMIEDNQKNRVDTVQRFIKIDTDLVEQFQNELQNLKFNLIKQFDELISNSVDWIKSLNEIVKLNTQYDFYDELEELINNSNTKTEQIIDSIKNINNSFCAKINLKLSNLKNLELYSQSEKYLYNLNFSHHLRLIDNSIKQKLECYAISFNLSGSLMISTYNCDIKVWEFVQGSLKEITTLKGHNKTILCLQFSYKSNSFLSAGFDNSIICWKQINEKEWKSSQSQQKHTNCIHCLILNQSEKELISSGSDHSIKIWQIDFNKNEINYLYSLDNHTNNVWSLSFSQSENTLVSCGSDNQIIIWKKDNQQKWFIENIIQNKELQLQKQLSSYKLKILKFQNYITQTAQDSGCRLCFINDDQFVWVTGNRVSKDCISMFELKNGKYQENLEKEVQLIKNGNNCDLNLYPIFYNKEQRLMIVKHKDNVYLIQISKQGQLKIVTNIKYESNSIQGALSKDGRYLVNWNKATMNFDILEILNN